MEAYTRVRSRFRQTMKAGILRAVFTPGRFRSRQTTRAGMFALGRFRSRQTTKAETFGWFSFVSLFISPPNPVRGA
jgi:hypothetical protein